MGSLCELVSRPSRFPITYDPSPITLRRRDAATATVRDRSQSESAVGDARPSLAGFRTTRVRFDLACRSLSAAKPPRSALSRRLDAVGGAGVADREATDRHPGEQQHLPAPAAA